MQMGRGKSSEVAQVSLASDAVLCLRCFALCLLLSVWLVGFLFVGLFVSFRFGFVCTFAFSLVSCFCFGFVLLLLSWFYSDI